MGDILKTIKEELPNVISDATFEGANIVLYTENKEFFKNSSDKMREIVDKIKYPKFSRRILKPSRYLVLTEELANYPSLTLGTIRLLKETEKGMRRSDRKRLHILKKENKEEIIEFLRAKV